MNCKICFEIYDNNKHKPFTLIPCGHSFCSTCVVELKTCSLCMQDIDSIKPNYVLIENLDYIMNYELRQSIIKDLKEVEDLNFEISLLKKKVIYGVELKFESATKSLLDQIEEYKKKLLTKIELIKNKSIPKLDSHVLQIRDINSLDSLNMNAYKAEIQTEKLKLESKINLIKQISIDQIEHEIANLFLSTINLASISKEIKPYQVFIFLILKMYT